MQTELIEMDKLVENGQIGDVLGWLGAWLGGYL